MERLSLSDIYRSDMVFFGCKPLSPEETAALLGQKSTSPQARDRLIEGCLPVVILLAHRFREQHRDAGIDFLDLVQEGSKGAISAVRTFKPALRGSTLLAHVYRRVKGCLSDFVHKELEQRHLSLEELTVPDDELTLADILPDPNGDFTGEVLAADIMKHPSRRLNPRESRTAELRLEGNTLKEIGQVLGVSRQRASQIAKRAREKIEGIPSLPHGRHRLH